jgi:hypothetical protein
MKAPCCSCCEPPRGQVEREKPWRDRSKLKSLCSKHAVVTHSGLEYLGTSISSYIYVRTTFKSLSTSVTTLKKKFAILVGWRFYVSNSHMGSPNTSCLCLFIRPLVWFSSLIHGAWTHTSHLERVGLFDTSKEPSSCANTWYQGLARLRLPYQRLGPRPLRQSCSKTRYHHVSSLAIGDSTTMDKLRRPIGRSRLLKATWEAFDNVLDSRPMNLYFRNGLSHTV